MAEYSPRLVDINIELSFQLIERVVLDHPHHTLFIILALANGSKDGDIPSKKTGGGGGRRGRLSAGRTGSEEEPEAQQVGAFHIHLNKGRSLKV